MIAVVGLGVTGRSAVRRLLDRGEEVVAVDDQPSEEAAAFAANAGVDLAVAPDRDALAALIRHADFVVVSPGVPARHPVFSVAEQERVEVISEIELGARWAKCPLVAVTGTNGKTTVTTLVQRMLEASGASAATAGNIGLPLVDAVHDDSDVIVVEVSSFQLQHTVSFRPSVATWLNFAEDHLDWHPTMAHYAEAKARIWANQEGDDVAVVNVDDHVVREAAARAPARVVTFGNEASADWTVSGGELRTPAGEVVVALEELPRSLPHDVANALAASATAVEAGADVAACRRVLVEFAGLPHRVELVAHSGGVGWYDDSKATTPASVVAALHGFDSVVLIAGGRNKGLDLSVLATCADRVRAVVAIGEAAAEVAAVFDGIRPFTVAESMREAVERARALARPGDAVVLSPGCASYDWYRNYAERGDDFAREVRAQVAS